jgi:hypothetical protein
VGDAGDVIDRELEKGTRLPGTIRLYLSRLIKFLEWVSGNSTWVTSAGDLFPEKKEQKNSTNFVTFLHFWSQLNFNAFRNGELILQDYT